MTDKFAPSKTVKSILIVDDSAMNLQLLAGVLKDDYKIKVAKDGQKAVDIVNSDPSVNLILMDVQMPNMDGFEAINLIKENPSTEHIPVISLTGLNDADNKSKGLKAGAIDFIVKPFNSEIVKACIKSHLGV